MDSMDRAIFAALYLEHSRFTWVHFTPHGTVRGGLGDAYLRRPANWF